MSDAVFVGIGFGAIQGGLFACEAFRSGRFSRIVVAEIRPDVVRAVRRAGGRYSLNVAARTGVEVRAVTGVEILDPTSPADRPALVAAVRDATEICTALPGVAFYTGGGAPAARLLAEGLRGKTSPCAIYAAENHCGAAGILERALAGELGALPGTVQVLGTVIGKMSGVVTDAGEIARCGLSPLADGLPQAFLVEAFDRILISKIRLPGFRRGLEAFAEKDDLTPFQEAKLYGHNATHALLGFLAQRRGCRLISEAAGHGDLMDLARAAFVEESGRALIARHGGKDELFTSAGYRAYADDLLERMVNPWLGDTVARVVRDPRRKLGWTDRLIGTLRVALDAGIVPHRFALAAAAALDLVAAETPLVSRAATLDALWPEPDTPPGRKQALKDLIPGVLDAGPVGR
jgi:mannitol-1-phosphate 5-dehydrogenase